MAPRKKVVKPSVELVEKVTTDTIEIDITDQALMPDPVPASSHVALANREQLTFPRPQFDRLLPIVATIMASIALGAVVLATGIMIGAGF